ncbi:hypothetical protein FF38_07036 [Lucilia cuprina]|uniref:Rho-GAP domain-containing protein n=1 Tax=Lucilia cuprina TaxID=7375 RepID=A0A0L0BKR8_LUCCU|nr:hypothetical protein FF38_07036 [Lucilia cuprina]
MAEAGKIPPTHVNLRRPVQIVKKRSGPLDEVLAELNKSETVCTTTSTPSSSNHVKSAAAPTNFGSHVKIANVTRPSPTLTRRRSTLKDKEKKRERWLLTRKTWKYMTDAGRKLIPDGVQNRQEDIPKIEAHFQKVCASEPHFVLWRRKSSYPGAMRNSKKRLKQLLQHTGQKSHALEQEEINNADLVLELLHSHLKLDEAIKTDTLLGTKTEGPHQTNSPSAQRPKPITRSIRKSDGMNVSLRGPGFLPPAATQLQELSVEDQLLQRLLALSRSSMLPDTIDIPPEKINAELLNDKATLKKIYNALKKQQLHRILTKHSIPSKSRTNLTHSTSMLSLLHFGSSQPKTKTFISTGEKSIKTKSPTIASNCSSIPSLSSSTTSITPVTTTGQYTHNDSGIQPVVPRRQRKPPTTLNLSGISNSSRKDQQHRPAVIEKQLNSCGTQTNFIPLSEIKRLAEDYKEYKREEIAAEAGGAGGGNVTTDDEGEKQASYSHRRKSSIDNEDVSQSVSDTIKRYLRMARKKSIHDENANRFKRVNYDRNLRNIQAKGEINPPGMDEDNNKAVQTLDAWALITLDFIRGNENSGVLETAHNDWQKALDERVQRKLEYEQKINAKHDRQQQPRSSVVYQSTSSCSSSAPTSPTSIQSPTMMNRTSTSSSGSYDVRSATEHTNVGSVGTNVVVGINTSGENIGNMGGIFHSSSQFIANLWHGTTNSSNCSSPTSIATSSNNQKHDQLSPSSFNDSIDVNIASNNSADMIKSKSLSHIGQYVSTKILKGHTKNQQKSSELLPLNSSNTSKVPKWSKSGKCSWSSETGERIDLCDCAFHILSELEAKMVQKICLEKIVELNIGIDLSTFSEDKSHKRRLLTKKRAMTTSFFDVGKKDTNVTDHTTSLFGHSLEECVINDKKREMSNLSATSDRGSRNSIVSLFRVGSSRGVKDSINSHKLNENVRSCENLPTEHETQCDNVKSNSKYTTITNYLGNMTKSASRRISRSQTDVRRGSHDHSVISTHIRDNDDGADVPIYKPLQVPQFVTCCINYLEENGLHKVGIFRVSTSKKRVKQMRDNFDKNNDKSFDDDTCPHNVATLLKEFLRDLPEPLLSNGLYNAFLETQKIRNRRLQLEALSHLVKLLPPAHRDTLYVLLKFLAKVAACSDDICDNDGTVHLTGNKMDSNNLATVFAPNILRSTEKYKSSSRDYLNSSKEQESISDAINVIRGGAMEA